MDEKMDKMTKMGGPAGSRDPMYDKPYMDIDEWRDQPVRHRYVHGRFISPPGFRLPGNQ